MEISKTEPTKSEIQIKPGLRVNIDSIWYRVEGPTTVPTEIPDTWTLVGYCISGETGVPAKKIILQKTSSQIREYISDWTAGQVFKEGCQLPPPRIEKRPYPTGQAFIQRIMEARLKRNPNIQVLSA